MALYSHGSLKLSDGTSIGYKRLVSQEEVAQAFSSSPVTRSRYNARGFFGKTLGLFVPVVVLIFFFRFLSSGGDLVVNPDNLLFTFLEFVKSMNFSSDFLMWTLRNFTSLRTIGFNVVLQAVAIQGNFILFLVALVLCALEFLLQIFALLFIVA